MSLCFRLIAVEFTRSPIRFLDRKPFDMGIAGDKPRQLAPTVGTLGIGIMNSTAFSLLANSNSEVDEIQIPFRTIDFQPHQSSFTQVFESMDQDMDLTIGSLNFRIGSLGSIRLSDPAKPGPLAVSA